MHYPPRGVTFGAWLRNYRLTSFYISSYPQDAYPFVMGQRTRAFVLVVRNHPKNLHTTSFLYLFLFFCPPTYLLLRPGLQKSNRPIKSDWNTSIPKKPSNRLVKKWSSNRPICTDILWLNTENNLCILINKLFTYGQKKKN